MRYACFLLLVFIAASPAFGFPGDDAGIAALQRELSPLPTGERIARWAEAFVDTPYDPDPLGAYVTRRDIVADDEVDCMYHAFRSVELALSNTPEGAVDQALSMRFFTRGKLDGSGKVENYDERYQYAMDMLHSGKWGTEITSSLGPVQSVPGARQYGPQPYIPAADAGAAIEGLKNGDIIFFVKDPAKRVVGEIIGHIGIIERENGTVYLIHASGSKNRGGTVRKVPLKDYLAGTNFVGFKISRF